MRLHQLVLNVLPSYEQSLSNYIIGTNTEALHAANMLTAGRSLYLWGEKGCGKSHILQAITKKLGSEYLNHSNCSQILKLALENEVDFFPKLITIDDIHLLNEQQQSGLFSLYNRWRELSNTKKAFAMLLAGDKNPSLINIREDIRTRLSWDLSFRIEALSDNDKSNALKSLANDLGISNIDNVIQWMLRYCNRDIKYLTHLLELLNKYSISTKRPITINLLKTMIKELEFIKL